MSEDTELLRRYARAGDEAAFAELVRRYLSLVYHAAQRQFEGDAHAAEDVTQKVFVLLAGKAARLTRHTALAGWLHTTTRHLAAEAKRAEHRRRIREQEAFIMQETTGERPGADAAWADLRPVIDEALGELDERDREVVLLRYFSDLPHAQIGARLALNENAARMRVERALDKLHARLARRGITSTSAALGLALANQAVAAESVVPAGLAGSVTSAALAGVGAGVVAPVVGVLGFMTTAKLVVGVAAVLGVAGLGTALHEWRQVDRAEATVAAMRREVEGLRAQVAQSELRAQAAEKRAQAGETTITELRNEIASARSAMPVPAAVGASPRASTTGATTGGYPDQMKMLSNPDYFRLHMQKYRAGLGAQYAVLYKSLGLTPGQIAAFEDNRTRAEQVTLELFSSAESQGVGASDPVVTALARQPLGDLESDLRTNLGDAGYKRYFDFRRALSAMDIVGSLAARTYGSAEPLAGAQGERLTQIVVDQTRAVPVAPGAKTLRYETNWAAVGEEAKRVLSPGQATTLQALLEMKELQARMSELSRAQRPSERAASVRGTP